MLHSAIAFAKLLYVHNFFNYKKLKPKFSFRSNIKMPFYINKNMEIVVLLSKYH